MIVASRIPIIMLVLHLGAPLPAQVPAPKPKPPPPAYLRVLVGSSDPQLFFKVTRQGASDQTPVCLFEGRGSTSIGIYQEITDGAVLLKTTIGTAAQSSETFDVKPGDFLTLNLLGAQPSSLPKVTLDNWSAKFRPDFPPTEPGLTIYNLAGPYFTFHLAVGGKVISALKTDQSATFPIGQKSVPVQVDLVDITRQKKGTINTTFSLGTAKSGILILYRDYRGKVGTRWAVGGTLD